MCGGQKKQHLKTEKKIFLKNFLFKQPVSSSSSKNDRQHLLPIANLLVSISVSILAYSKSSGLYSYCYSCLITTYSSDLFSRTNYNAVVFF